MKTPKPHGWRPWGDHPVIAIIALMSGLLTLYSFLKSNIETQVTKQSETSMQEQFVSPTSKQSNSFYVTPEKTLEIEKEEKQELPKNDISSVEIDNAIQRQKIEEERTTYLARESLVGKWEYQGWFGTDYYEFTQDGRYIYGVMKDGIPYKVLNPSQVQLVLGNKISIVQYKVLNDTLYWYGNLEMKRVK